jgi:hypothetical protein
LILTIDQIPTQLTILNYFLETMVVNGVPAPDYHKVERIVFGDGTVWDNAAMAPHIIRFRAASPTPSRRMSRISR